MLTKTPSSAARLFRVRWSVWFDNYPFLIEFRHLSGQLKQIAGSVTEIQIRFGRFSAVTVVRARDAEMSVAENA